MEATEIKSWHASSTIEYFIWHHNENEYYIRISKRKASYLLVNLFVDDTEELYKLGGSHFLLSRELWKIGAVKTAAYAKQILDASLSKILSLPITVIALYALADSTGEKLEDFLTERLVGKKRLTHWDEHLSKYSLSWEDPKLCALLNMFGNSDVDLETFIEQHKKKIFHIINDCEY